CVAELFMAGAIGRNGKFVEDLGTPFVREGTRGLEYVLVSAEDSGTGTDILLTEVDIDNLMRAKAAVYAGTSVLLETVEVEYDEIDEVVVAGGFGHYLDLERVTALGMMPEVDRSKFLFIGNGSLLGARAVATSRELLQKAQDVSRMLTYVELSVNAGFMDSYMSAMFFPHTDLSLFPRSEERLRERGRSKAVR
ncbi:MAG: ATP-binding protein, partial [Coriobacteriia bacterium]|nr:ATP-binding protein [Coriobacteriia bacterium]